MSLQQRYPLLKRIAKSILLVVGILLALSLLLLIGVSIYIGWYYREYSPENVQITSMQIRVRESDLAQEQEDALLAEVRQLRKDFDDGRLTVYDLSRVGKAIAESPLLPLANVQGARHTYVERSDMTPDEKAAAILALQRFVRGVHEKKIRASEIERMILSARVRGSSTLAPYGSDLSTSISRWKLRDNPTREQVDQFVAYAKARADEAMVPEKPFELSIVDELKKTILEAKRAGADSLQ